jgi:serine protease Do
LTSPRDLPRLVGNTKPGNKSAITVFRRGFIARTLSIVIGEFEPEKPSAHAVRAGRKAQGSGAAAQSLGLTVSDLTEAQKKELKFKGWRAVDAASEAAPRAGIREGDVILAIGQHRGRPREGVRGSRGEARQEQARQRPVPPG